MIKPEAVAKGYIGKIIDHIISGGFKIIAMKYVHLTLEQAQGFYEVHKGKGFYEDLTKYMSASPIVVIALEKENAVADFRALIGSTDPNEANEGTIRKRFAESKSKNAVHGSDSDENAEIEINFHFKKEEVVG
jgi:nucleoside-diphosphate kinase